MTEPGTGPGSCVVTGGRVLVEGDLVEATVRIDDGLITAVTTSDRSSHSTADAGPAPEADTHVIDAEGATVSAGFVDVQVNGAIGNDITSDPDSIGVIARALPQWGVTSFAPTVITSERCTRSRAIDALRAYRSAPVAGAADPVGLHFEGPALAPGRLGTHDPEMRAVPTIDEVRDWCDSGMVSMVTLAPELDGVDEIIDVLVAAGITVSIGHTDATPPQVRRAADLGVRSVTHLFNAMAPLHHRSPGTVGAALDDDRLTVGLITDGVHLDPLVVRLAWRLLGPDRTVLVTDGAAAMGAADGRYTIGSVPITVESGAVRNDDGSLAGGAATFDQIVRGFVESTHCTMSDVAVVASAGPAELVGLHDRGAVEVGRRGDLVLLDDDLGVVATVVTGVCAWRS